MDEAEALHADDSKSADRVPPHQVTSDGVQACRQELVELARRTLLERGQMCEIRERIKELAERLAKLTPERAAD